MKEVKIVWPENAEKIFKRENLALLEQSLTILLQHDPLVLKNSKKAYKEAYDLYHPLLDEAWKKMIPLISAYIFGKYGKVKRSPLESGSEIQYSLQFTIENEERFAVKESKRTLVFSEARKRVHQYSIDEMRDIKNLQEEIIIESSLNLAHLFRMELITRVWNFVFVELIKRLHSSQRLSSFEEVAFYNLGKTSNESLKKCNEFRMKHPGYDGAFHYFQQYQNTLGIYEFVRREIDISLSTNMTIEVIDSLTDIISTYRSYGIPSAVSKIHLSEREQYASFEAISMDFNSSFCRHAILICYPSNLSLNTVYDASRISKASDNEKWGITLSIPENGVAFYMNLNWEIEAPFDPNPNDLRTLIGEKAYNILHLNVLMILAEYLLHEDVYNEKVAPLLGKVKKDVVARKSTSERNSKISASMQLVLQKYFPLNPIREAESSNTQVSPIDPSPVMEKRVMIYNVPYFKRLLPKNHHPSPSALMLAEKQGIHLGYAIVLTDGRRIESAQVLEIVSDTGMVESDVIGYFELEGGVYREYTFVEIESTLEEYQNLKTIVAKTKYTTTS